MEKAIFLDLSYAVCGVLCTYIRYDKKNENDFHFFCLYSSKEWVKM